MTTATPNALRQHAAQQRAEELSSHVLPLRAEGKSLRQIAAALTASAVPTANGGAWGPKQVLDILHRLEQQPEPLPERRDPLAALIVTEQAAPIAGGDPLAAFLPRSPLAS